MRRAKCQECDFTAGRLTRAEADTALVAHTQATKHQAWLMVPVPDRPDVTDGERSDKGEDHVRR